MHRFAGDENMYGAQGVPVGYIARIFMYRTKSGKIFTKATIVSRAATVFASVFISRFLLGALPKNSSQR